MREKENDRGGENIRDILDDLSFRLESLSVEKPKSRPRPGVDNFEPVSDLFKSAESSPAPASDEKGKGVGGAVFYDEDDCVALGSDGKGKPKEEVDDGLIDVLDDDDYDEKSCNFDDEHTGGIVMDPIGSFKGKRYVLPAKTAKMLYPHQREGLKWFWNLHCSATGGILGDDMGLGKTMQVRLNKGFFLVGVLSISLHFLFLILYKFVLAVL